MVNAKAQPMKCTAKRPFRLGIFGTDIRHDLAAFILRPNVQRFLLLNDLVIDKKSVECISNSLC